MIVNVCLRPVAAFEHSFDVRNQRDLASFCRVLGLYLDPRVQGGTSEVALLCCRSTGLGTNCKGGTETIKHALAAALIEGPTIFTLNVRNFYNQKQFDYCRPHPPDQLVWGAPGLS